MITSLEFGNYRGFKHYRLSGLSRVNLLVGKNNCGKTSVLEAMHLLAADGDPSVLAATASRRGEVVAPENGLPAEMGKASPVIVHFFHGHKFGLKTSFSLSCEGQRQSKLRFHVALRLPGKGRQASLFADVADKLMPLALCLDADKGLFPGISEEVLLLSAEGAISSVDHEYRYRRMERSSTRTFVPVQFIALDSLEPISMSDMWDRVIVEGRESEVVEAMKTLEPEIDSISFLSGDTAYRYGGRGGVVVGLKRARQRYPLGSYGDGMRRLLILSISLIQTEGGILLVDEIDTGLHYSIMGDMWRLVVGAAKQSNVQVFATTHSSDCVRGLAWLCENHPSLGEEVSVQKIDPQLDEAVALHAREIVTAVEQDIEVR